MIFDKRHLPWAAFFVVALGASTAVYWIDEREPIGGTTHRNAARLAFGIAGAACLLVAALYSVRKRLPRWPLGSAALWLRGHFWLSTLSLPLVLLHANFAFGNPLTRAALILLFVVAATGFWGVVMQHILPAAMKKRLPVETAYGQIADTCDRLRSEADEIVMRACGSILEDAKKSVATTDHVKVRNFYRNHVRPFLVAGLNLRSEMLDPEQAEVLFRELQSDVDPALHATIRQLISRCERRRQLVTQFRMHRWLHAWLLIHIPASIVLLALVVVHIVTALMPK